MLELRDKMPQMKNEANIHKTGGPEEENRKQDTKVLKKKKKAFLKYRKISFWRLKGVTI